VGFLERTEWDGDLTCAGIGSGSRAAAPPASTGLSSQIPQRPPTRPLTASPPPPPASPPGPAGVGDSASCRSLRIAELGDLERQGLRGLWGGGWKSRAEDVVQRTMRRRRDGKFCWGTVSQLV
jgi:hypothetical protein